MTYRTTFLYVLYIGIALYLPFLAHAEEPIVQAVSEEIAPLSAPEGSNILFIPGIKGSRLFDGQGNKLWEPFGNHDIEDLMLDEDGKSLRDDIHTEPGEIVDTVAGFTDIYGSFMDFLDGLVAEDVIQSWASTPYDWRLSLPDIVNEGIGSGPTPMALQNMYGVPPIREVLDNLSHESKTGKVTIIAHSNGGLVTKQLLQSIGDEETQRLVDKIIFVGVPQSGAPQALAALLYGYKEGLPWWFPGIVSISTARTFAENSPMGYHLLPSAAYFESTDTPVVTFNASHSYAEEQTAYGSSIDSFEELRAFALAEEGGREKPNPSNFNDSNVLNESLLVYGKATHDEIDTWLPPAGVQLYQVAGWGENTVSGIEYYDQCIFNFCEEMYRPTFSLDGDGVVPERSAQMISESDSIKNYWIGLPEYDRGIFGGKDHGSLLTIPEVRELVTAIQTSSSQIPSQIYTERPEADRRVSEFRFFLHSPLSLELHDSTGNRVGPNEDGSSEIEIPGATYGQLGDVQFLIVPSGESYDLKLDGYDSGEFTLEIQEVEEGHVTASITFENLPTTPDTLAEMHVSTQLNTRDSLNLDIDGDGVTDMIPVPLVKGDVLNDSSEERVADSRSFAGKKKIENSSKNYADGENELLELYLELLKILLAYLKNSSD